MYSELQADIAIIGGSTGGCAAALAAVKAGKRVILTEETDWIGGQLTSQAVPPDEHGYIEKFGCTYSYRQFRNKVRAYYRNNFPLTEQARNTAYLNPGNGGVGKVCHDPRVALAVLEEMLAPYVHSGRLTVLTMYKIESVDVTNEKVSFAKVKDLRTGDVITISAKYFLDATDCGDVLPLAGVEYRTGAESQKQTNEPHALQGNPDPFDMQAVTHCFAVDYMEGEDFTIERPRDYDFWKKYRVDYWPDNQLGWYTPHHITHAPLKWSLFGEEGGRNLFQYRRIIDKSNFLPGTFTSDITIINVPQTDYFLGPVFDVPDAGKHLKGAKQLSLSYLYWLQTEAPRPDGGQGYRGLRLRHDVTGTSDGLAKSVYIRESRRIQAEFTVCEQHVSPSARSSNKAEIFKDSVGIGLYRIDLHPSTGKRNYIDIDCLPFQIPLGSLIPVRMDNLLPACKNIGTTHITNGCYRLHPVEWNIGESAGYLAAYCVEKGVIPRQVRNESTLLTDFQSYLEREGIELSWPSV